MLSGPEGGFGCWSWASNSKGSGRKHLQGLLALGFILWKQWAVWEHLLKLLQAINCAES